MNLRVLLYSLLVLFLGISGLFSWSAYSYYESIHSDDPIIPFLEVREGVGKIVRQDLTYELSGGETYNLRDNDIVETGKESNAMIRWPDKSITRLGPNTRVVIQKMFASTSYDRIEVAYSIERGKVWNTVIRSLVGDSYFEVRLPRESIVAGVRGTIFEVNLDNRYIQAIDHVTTLTDKSKGIIELFPGELVDSENIWIKKGREWIDATWNEFNTQGDTVYKKIRDIEIEERISGLTKGIGEFSLSRFERRVLSQFSGFEDLGIAEFLSANNTGELLKYSPEQLLTYYQKLSGVAQNQNKEILRNTLLSLDSPLIANIRNSLDMHAFWQSLDTGRLLPSVEAYLQNKGVNTDDFKAKFTEGAKNDIQKLRESFSGSLEELFGLELSNN